MDLKEIPSLVIGLQMKISGNAWSLDRRLLQQMSPSHEPIMTKLLQKTLKDFGAYERLTMAEGYNRIYIEREVIVFTKQLKVIIQAQITENNLVSIYRTQDLEPSI